MSFIEEIEKENKKSMKRLEDNSKRAEKAYRDFIRVCG